MKKFVLIAMMSLVSVQAMGAADVEVNRGKRDTRVETEDQKAKRIALEQQQTQLAAERQKTQEALVDAPAAAQDARMITENAFAKNEADADDVAAIKAEEKIVADPQGMINGNKVGYDNVVKIVKGVQAACKSGVCYLQGKVAKAHDVIVGLHQRFSMTTKEVAGACN